MAGKKGAATAEDQSQQDASNIDIDDLASKIGEKLAGQVSMEAIKDFMKDLLSEMGYSDQEITDELIVKAFHKMPSEKKDPMLRSVGLVPTPGFFSSVLGWHNVEHLRSAGWRNKVAGLSGIFYQGVAVGLAAYLGVDWYQNRAA